MDSKPCTMANGCLRDPQIYEYLTNGSFWVLAILIAINGQFVKEQALRFSDYHRQLNAPGEEPQRTGVEPPQDPTSDKPSDSSGTRDGSPRRYRFFWLQPHITSSPRQFLALFIASLILAAHIIEGSWVLKTTWRVTSTLFTNTSASRGPLLVRGLLYGFGAGVGLVAWYFVLVHGVIMVSGQFLLVSHLLFTQPEDPLGHILTRG